MAEGKNTATTAPIICLLTIDKRYQTYYVGTRNHFLKYLIEEIGLEWSY